MEHRVEVLIVCVNFKTADLVRNLLISLEQEVSAISAKMVIVDNFSCDGSFDQIRRFIAENNYDWADVIQSNSNSGYAAGNNLALRYASDKWDGFNYVWFLNPDTTVRDGAGLNLKLFLENERAHAAGSRLEDEDGTWQSSHFNFPNIFSEFSSGLRLGLLDKFIGMKLVRRCEESEPTVTDWLAGASFMVSTDFLKTVGLLDEGFFLYYEEVDYCYRGKKAGMPCWYVPSSKVYHYVGAATGISDQRKKAPRRPKYWFDSRRRFILKNYGKANLVVSDFAFILGYSIWLLRKTIVFSKAIDKEPPLFFRDFIRNSFIFRGFKF